MKNIKKEITFIYTDKLEYQCAEPIANEAKKRGYEVKFSNNIFEKCEIGFYCQHLCFPKNSKFSCIMLHDLGQQHGFWPNMWQNEIWNHFDLGFLPSKEWCDMWIQSSCYDFVRPRKGCYYAGWPKSDNIYEKFFDDECQEIIKNYGIDTSKKTLLYAPSWEYDNRQLELVDACKDLDINVIVKQFPWNPDESAIFKFQYDLCKEMAEKCKGLPNVYVLDTSVNIFNAINICDLLISEESSTLYEAMMLEKPVIAVTDWLVPDNYPEKPRYPDFPYDFAVHTSKENLTEVIKNVITDNTYLEKIKEYRQENFSNIGNASCTIMDVIDSVLFSNGEKIKRLEEKSLVLTPRKFKKSVAIRKAAMRHTKIKMKIIDHSNILKYVYSILRYLKHREK